MEITNGVSFHVLSSYEPKHFAMYIATYSQQYQWYLEKAIRYPLSVNKSNNEELLDYKIVDRAQYLMSLCKQSTEGSTIPKYYLLEAGTPVTACCLNGNHTTEGCDEYEDLDSLYSKKSDENSKETTMRL